MSAGWKRKSTRFVICYWSSLFIIVFLINNIVFNSTQHERIVEKRRLKAERLAARKAAAATDSDVEDE